jgi:hypothetical protein
MADSRTYSINDVLVTIDGVRITGLAASDPVAVAFTEDDTTAVNGANGDVAFAYNNNNIAELTLQTLQTSPDNDVLNTKVNAILRARRGSLAIEVMDGRGRTLVVMAQAVPKKRPDVAMAPEVGSRSWVFHGRVDAYDVGSNELA